MNKSSNSNLEKAQEKVDSLEKEINNVQILIDNYKTNLEDCQLEIDCTNNKLAEAKPIRDIQNKLLALKNQKTGKEELLNHDKKSIRDSYFNIGHTIIMDDFYPKTKDYLNQLLVEQDDLIPIEVISKILTDQKCICGESLNNNEIALANIKKLEAKFKRSKTTPFIGQINGAIDDYLISKDSILANIKKDLIKFEEIKSDIDFLDEKIEDLKKEQKGISMNETNLKELEDKIDYHLEIKNNIKDCISKNELKLEDLKGKEKDALKDYRKELSEDQNLKYDRKRLEYISNLRDEFKALLSKYSDDMRQQLIEETTKIFKILIDKKDKKLIDRIEINPSYEIELHNWNGTKITQDISQGQRQIVALSFITALAKVASQGNKYIDFPLFMDTPFGRMSGDNRDNLIKNIPELSSQWILLLTDTEFSYSEELAVKSTNKLGRWYRLKQLEVGHTVIEERPTSDQMATRR
jgi:DNA sulfur modification protein DndD